MEDSLGPEVRALLDGGALWDGLGCGGEGEVWPTRVWYLHGIGAAAPGGWDEAGVKEGRSGYGGCGSHGGWDCSDGEAWIRAAGRGRRGMTHPRPESVSSAGLHHGGTREGEEVERGTSKREMKM